VVLSSGVAVEYDWLVLALGADSVTFGIEGVKEHCIPFCSYPDAMKVLGSPVYNCCVSNSSANDSQMLKRQGPHNLMWLSPLCAALCVLQQLFPC